MEYKHPSAPDMHWEDLSSILEIEVNYKKCSQGYTIQVRCLLLCNEINTVNTIRTRTYVPTYRFCLV